MDKSKGEIKIGEQSSSPVIDIALDTIRIGKQALVFVGTRQSAEKAAEEISHNLKLGSVILNAVADEALNALPRPTKQCERLARCIKGGTAFHHSGLIGKQRQIIEDNFRNGAIKIICCTPTLAAGVDLPAFRAIIRDLKRFSEKGEYGYGGMSWIPVLEYLQMCGRAGRPSFDNEGQAIILADTDSEEEEFTARYINGKPEEIFSKLAVEPVLRTHLLSLIASGIVASREEAMDFFSRTFWAHQYRDFGQMEKIIDKMLSLLEEWKFITGTDQFGFKSALEMKRESIKPTQMGQRVAQLYLDPLTAHEIIEGFNKAAKMKQEEPEPFPMLHLISYTLEMRPLLRARAKELEEIQAALLKQNGMLLTEEPSMYEEAYEDFLASAKTAMFLNEWIDERDEEHLLEKYGIRPGEIHAKLTNADWLLYSAAEIAKIMKLQSLLNGIGKLRKRVEYGAKAELLPLLQLKGIGRVRARKLFSNKIHTLGDVKSADISTLTQILGSGKIASDIKQHLGEKTETIKEGKRKGQINLNDYAERKVFKQ